MVSQNVVNLIVMLGMVLVVMAFFSPLVLQGSEVKVPGEEQAELGIKKQPLTQVGGHVASDVIALRDKIVAVLENADLFIPKDRTKPVTEPVKFGAHQFTPLFHGEVIADSFGNNGIYPVYSFNGESVSSDHRIVLKQDDEDIVIVTETKEGAIVGLPHRISGKHLCVVSEVKGRASAFEAVAIKRYATESVIEDVFGSNHPDQPFLSLSATKTFTFSQSRFVVLPGKNGNPYLCFVPNTFSHRLSTQASQPQVKPFSFTIIDYVETLKEFTDGEKGIEQKTISINAPDYQIQGNYVMYVLPHPSERWNQQIEVRQAKGDVVIDALTSQRVNVRSELLKGKRFFVIIPKSRTLLLDVVDYTLDNPAVIEITNIRGSTTNLAVTSPERSFSQGLRGVVTFNKNDFGIVID